MPLRGTVSFAVLSLLLGASAQTPAVLWASVLTTELWAIFPVSPLVDLARGGLLVPMRAHAKLPGGRPL